MNNLSRKARTEASASKEAGADLPEGPGWDDLTAARDEADWRENVLGWDQYRERRSPLGNVLSAALAFALVAGVMLLVAIFRVGE